MYDTVCDSWILSRTAALEQQVAGLRLVLACLSAWSFQYPLTEDRCMELLLVGGGGGFFGGGRVRYVPEPNK